MGRLGLFLAVDLDAEANVVYDVDTAFGVHLNAGWEGEAIFRFEIGYHAAFFEVGDV